MFFLENSMKGDIGKLVTRYFFFVTSLQPVNKII